jgi:hypothetical protein
MPESGCDVCEAEIVRPSRGARADRLLDPPADLDRVQRSRSRSRLFAVLLRALARFARLDQGLVRQTAEVDHAHVAHFAAVDDDDRSGILSHVDEEHCFLGRTQGRGSRGIHHRGGLELRVERLDSRPFAQLESRADVDLRSRRHEELARLVGTAQDVEVHDHVLDTPLRELALHLELDHLRDLVAIAEGDAQVTESSVTRVQREEDVLARNTMRARRFLEDGDRGRAILLRRSRELTRAVSSDLVLLDAAVDDDELVAPGADADPAGACHGRSVRGGERNGRREPGELLATRGGKDLLLDQALVLLGPRAELGFVRSNVLVQALTPHEPVHVSLVALEQRSQARTLRESWKWSTSMVS